MDKSLKPRVLNLKPETQPHPNDRNHKPFFPSQQGSFSRLFLGLVLTAATPCPDSPSQKVLYIRTGSLSYVKSFDLQVFGLGLKLRVQDIWSGFTLSVQVPDKHILSPNQYYNLYYQAQVLNYWVQGPFGLRVLNNNI